MNDHLRNICLKLAVIGGVTVFYIHFEYNRLGSDTYFGINVRTMSMLYIFTGMVFGITRDWFAWKFPDYKTNKKVHVYVAELVVSTLAIILGTRVCYEAFFGSSDCNADANFLPIKLYEGVCVGLDVPSGNPHTSIVFSRSGIEHVPSEHVNDVIHFEDSCLLKNMYMFGQSFQLLVVLYQTELLYLNHEMRIELQIHHLCAILLSLFPFYADASTVVIQVSYLNWFFAMFEQPVFFALLMYKLVDGKYALKKQLFVFAGVFWAITKLLVFIVSLYVLVVDSEYIQNTVKGMLIVLSTVFGITQMYTLLAIKGLIHKCNKKMSERQVG